MKKIFAIPMILLSAALCLTACSLTGSCVPGDGKVTASLEAMTRTQLLPEGNLYQVLWRTGDRIAVTDGTVTACYTAESGGGATATFAPEGTPTLSSGPYTAWYPASLADGILPSVQTYRAGGVAEVPMCATSEDLTFGFCNLGGFIRLDVTTALTDIKIDRIVLKADSSSAAESRLSFPEATASGWTVAAWPWAQIPSRSTSAFRPTLTRASPLRFTPRMGRVSRFASRRMPPTA